LELLREYQKITGRRVAEIRLHQENGEILPVEVTSSEEVPREKLRRLLSFMRKYNLKTGVLVYGGGSAGRKRWTGKRLNSCLSSDLLFDSSCSHLFSMPSVLDTKQLMVGSPNPMESC
jgi:hypothetical protein